MLKRLIIVAILLLIVATAGAVIYKWVDEKGVINYSTNPPADRKVEVFTPFLP